MAVAEALVGAHQQGFIGTVAAADAGLYGAVGAFHAGHRGLLRRASRDHRTAHGGVVVEIHAAQHFVYVVAEGEIGGDGEIAGHLALHAEREVLRLGRDEILHEKIAAGLENVDVAHREIGVAGVDIQLLDGGGPDQRQNRIQQASGEKRRHAQIERRAHRQPWNAGDRVGNDRPGQRQIARAERSQVGALHQAGFDIERVVEDAAAAPDDRAVIGQAPGEARRRREAQPGVLFVAQAAGAEDGRQVLRLGKVVVQRVAFETPGQAIVDGETRAQFPGVLPVQMEEPVVVGLAALESGGLIDVPDTEGEGFEREAQDVGDGVERAGHEHRQRRRELPHFFGGEQRDVGGRIQRIGARAFQEFDLRAELHAVGGVLPRHVIGENIAAGEAALRGIGLIAEGHAGAFDGHVRPAQSEAAGALVRGGRRVVIAPEGIGVAELVDQGGAKRADQREHSGVGPVDVALPGRGQGVDFARRERIVAVVRIAHEGRVGRADAVVDARVGQVFVLGAGGDTGQTAEGRVGGHAGEDPLLVVVFVGGEEEEAVLHHRAAHPQAALAAREERVGRQRVALQPRIRGHVVIPEKEKAAAVQLVAAAARHDVDGSGGRNAGREIEVDARDLEFLHDFLGEVLLRAAIHGIVHPRAIHGDARAVGIASEYGDVHGAVVVALVIAGDGYARREKRQLQESAPVERQFLDLLAADDLVDGVRFHFELGADGFHRDRVLLFSQLEARIHRGDAAGCHHHFHRVAAEAGRVHPHSIGAGPQRRHAELAALVAQQGAFERRGLVLHFDGCVGYHRAGSIVDGAGDFAGGRLGRQSRYKTPNQQHPQKTWHLHIQPQTCRR